MVLLGILRQGLGSKGIIQPLVERELIFQLECAPADSTVYCFLLQDTGKV